MITETGLKGMVDRFYSESPTYGNPSEFSVGITQETPTFTDTELTDEVEISTGVTSKEFVADYPVIDLDNLTVKMRVFLNSLEANDEELNGIAIKDSSGNVYSINKFATQNKTSAVELSIIKSEKWDGN